MYSLAMPLLSVPVLELGDVVESPAWWAARFNVILAAAAAAVAYWLLRGRADPRLLRLTVLVLLFASFLSERLRDYNAEVMTASFVTVGIICIATGRYVLAGWAAIVIGVVNTPATIVGLVPRAAGAAPAVPAGGLGGDVDAVAVMLWMSSSAQASWRASSGDWPRSGQRGPRAVRFR